MTTKTETCSHGRYVDEPCEACETQKAHLASLPAPGSDESFDRMQRILDALTAQLSKASKLLSGPLTTSRPQRLVPDPHSSIGLKRWEDCTPDEAQDDAFMREIEYLGDLCHAVAFPEPGDLWDAK